MEKEKYEDSNLYKLRHTASHVLAMAALEFDPQLKLAIGPPIENGFYYDFEFTKPVTHADMKTIEKSMQKIINKNIPVEQKTMSHEEAVGMYASKKQIFKQELAENLEDKELGFYGIGDFWDLCKGPHVKSTGDIKAFKLLSLAGAYWRGDESQPMLTRIYGTAFENKTDLEKYLNMLEEARKRDHRKLGPALDLFTFSDLVGPGLPLWTPKGMVLRTVLDDFVWKLREKFGYERVEIPHLAKKELYITSGHWEKFSEQLFKIETREGHTYVLKPMNCPHHTQIFKRKMWSYRDMPQRYANSTMVYRDEQSGELSGLSRVLSITQDDAHVFCRPDQIKEEMGNIWTVIDEFYKAVGFELTVRASLRDPKSPEKYLGSPELWDSAEKALAELAKERNIKTVEGIGEATFYGPKLDFMAKDSLGREWQLATIQLDMNLPKRFDLTYITEKGEKENVVMIHCAIMGSFERYISVLIEHFAGAFPFWLSPVQVKVLPISDKVMEYAQEVNTELHKAGIRSVLDNTSETLGKKIRSGELEKIPYLLIIGEKEAEAGTITARVRHTAEQSTIELDKFVKSLVTENHP